jgi:hypothetical protein
MVLWKWLLRLIYASYRELCDMILCNIVCESEILLNFDLQSSKRYLIVDIKVALFRKIEVLNAPVLSAIRCRK